MTTLASFTIKDMISTICGLKTRSKFNCEHSDTLAPKKNKQLSLDFIVYKI